MRMVYLWKKLEKLGVRRMSSILSATKVMNKLNCCASNFLKNVIRDITEKIGISDVMPQNKKILNNP